MIDPGLRDALLRTLLEGAIIADTMEAGLDILGDRLGPDVSLAMIAGSVQDAVAAGLVYEPVRLLPGALQCHWHLQLTPRGRQAIADAE